MNHRRRRLLQAALGAAGFGAVSAHAALLPTPEQTEGPFYPWRMPLDRDNDLVRIAGRGSPAVGEITHLTGRVLDTRGNLVAGARVEIWQCDAHGFYHHVDDRERARRDSGFQGFGETMSAADGSYRFRTIKPAPYPGRTPHIHFKVSVRSGPALTTQLYVRGDRRNRSDFLFRHLSEEEQERVQAEFAPWDGDDQASLMARFDPVVQAE
ncbi:MAG: dioxygenase family protein [Panacagrimonas sp.]